jgi:tetratricopeptide (TPR) repeat protein
LAKPISKPQASYYYVPFLLLIGLQLAGSFFPGHAAWGFNYWGILPMPWPLMLILAAILCLPALSTTGYKLISACVRPLGSIPRVLSGFLLLSGVAAVMYILRFRSFVYGDSQETINQLQDFANGDGEVLLGMHPLTVILYRVVVTMFSNTAIAVADLLTALSIVAGMLATIAIYRLSVLLAESSTEQWILATGLFSCGATVLFFGYIEYYTWATAVSLWALYYSLKFICKPGSTPIWLPPTIGLLAAAFHYIYAPFFVVAILAVTSRQDSDGTAPLVFTWKQLNWLLVIGSIVVAALFQITGWTETFIPVWPTSDYPYWSLSLNHLHDVLNHALSVAPLGLALLIFMLIRKRSEQDIFDLATQVLGSTALITFLTAFWVDPKLGAPRDWDLLSLYGYPLTLLGILLYTRSLASQVDRRHLILPVLVVLLVQLGPNVYEKSNLPVAAERLDAILWEDQHYQVEFQDAYRCLPWAYILEDLTGDITRAVRYYHRRLEADPASTVALKGLAGYHYRKNQHDSAAVLFTKAYHSDKNDADIYIGLAMTEERRGNVDRAYSLILEAEKIRQDDHVMFRTHGIIASRLARNDEALLNFRKAYRMSAVEFDEPFNLALQFLKQNMADSALYYFAKAEPLAPNTADLYKGFIMAALHLKLYDEANRYLAKFQRLRPSSPDIAAFRERIDAGLRRR